METKTIAQVKTHAFSPFDLVAINCFVENLNLACDINGVRKGAARRLFRFFMNKTTSAVLNERTRAERIDKKPSRLASGKARYFTIHKQVANFMLNKYATGEEITEVDLETIRFAQASFVTPSQYVEKLIMKPIVV